MDITLAIICIMSFPAPHGSMLRYANRKVGGIRFMRVGRVFCSFGISR